MLNPAKATCSQYINFTQQLPKEVITQYTTITLRVKVHEDNFVLPDFWQCF